MRTIYVRADLCSRVITTKHVGVVVVVIVITVVGAYSIRAQLYLVLRWQTVFALVKGYQ